MQQKSSKKIRFTKSGHENYQSQYKKLLEDRKPALEDLKKSREMGDLSENGYYKASRFKLSDIDRRLREMAYNLKNAVVVQDSSSEFVDIGSKVVLEDDSEKIIEYFIVGDTESNPSVGKISLLSPLGRSLVGRKAGDIVQVRTPGGVVKYSIRLVQ